MACTAIAPYNDCMRAQQLFLYHDGSKKGISTPNGLIECIHKVMITGGKAQCGHGTPTCFLSLAIQVYRHHVSICDLPGRKSSWAMFTGRPWSGKVFCYGQLVLFTPTPTGPPNESATGRGASLITGLFVGYKILPGMVWRG